MGMIALGDSLPLKRMKVILAHYDDVGVDLLLCPLLLHVLDALNHCVVEMLFGVGHGFFSLLSDVTPESISQFNRANPISL